MTPASLAPLASMNAFMICLSGTNAFMICLSGTNASIMRPTRV